MLKKNLVKILSTAIIFAVLIGIVITISGAAKAVPEKEFGETEKLLPDVIFGSKGENFLPENIETDGENEENPPKENQITEIPESIPETPKKEQSENNRPNIDKVTEEGGGDTAGSGDGDVSGEGTPGEVTVVTDLENKIVTSAELSGDMFGFFAYIENGSEKHSLTINFKNSETSSVLISNPKPRRKTVFLDTAGCFSQFFASALIFDEVGVKDGGVSVFLKDSMIYF